MGNNSIKLTIVSPEKSLYDGTVKKMTLPGEAGSFTVFPGHAPLISSLQTGDIKYIDESGSEQKITIQSGFVEINNNTASVCIEQ